MKNTLIAVVAVLSLSVTGALGQAERTELAHSTPEQRAQIQTDFMKSHLKLTDAQVSQVSAINLEFAKKADPLLKGSEGDLSLIKQMKQIGEEKQAALQKVLTPDQFTQWQSLSSEIKQEMLDKLKAQQQQGSGG